MLECVDQMFLTAEDMGNAQIGVIGARRHVIGRHAGRAEQGEILKVAGPLSYRPVDKISYNDLCTRLSRHTEAQHEWFTRAGPAIALFAREVAHARIVEPSPIQIFRYRSGRREVPVREALLNDGPSGLAMKVAALRLPIELVPAELEPLKARVDGIERTLGVAVDVRIVDAENNRPFLVTRIQPVEDEGSCAAYVKVTGRRWRKADSCHTERLRT